MENIEITGENFELRTSNYVRQTVIGTEVNTTLIPLGVQILNSPNGYYIDLLQTFVSRQGGDAEESNAVVQINLSKSFVAISGVELDPYSLYDRDRETETVVDCAKSIQQVLMVVDVLQQVKRELFPESDLAVDDDNPQRIKLNSGRTFYEIRTVDSLESDKYIEITMDPLDSTDPIGSVTLEELLVLTTYKLNSRIKMDECNVFEVDHSEYTI